FKRFSLGLAFGFCVAVGLTIWAVYLRNQAHQAEGRAQSEARKAEANAAQIRERVVRMNVANGARYMRDGDYSDALLWFANALSLSQGDPVAERWNRIRCASVLRQCPRLLHVLVHSNIMEYAVFSPDGLRLLTTCNDGTARVWDVASGQPV